MCAWEIRSSPRLVPVRCWFIRLARIGTLAAAFWYRAALAQLWKSRAFSFSGSLSASKKLAEWFGLEVARLVVDECLAATELNALSISNAPVPSVTAIGNRGPRAGDQWAVPEMWLSGCVWVVVRGKTMHPKPEMLFSLVEID
jgi:hypothetical protein